MSRKKIREMLEYRLRPFSEESDQFTHKYFSQLEESIHQSFYKIIGQKPQVLFVCKYMSGLKYSGKNSLLQSDNSIFIDESDFRNSTNNFNHIVSAYVLLEMIRLKVPGIYLFLSNGNYEKDKFVNGTETIGYSSSSSIWGKLRECNQTIYLGNFGDRDLLITDCGYKVCSDAFKDFICKHFGLQFARANSYLHCKSSEIALGNFAEFIPENASLPVGVHLGKTEHNPNFYKYQKNLIVDLDYVEQLIDKLVNYPASQSPVKRIPDRVVEGEFIGHDLRKPKVASPKGSNEKSDIGLFSWLKTLF